MKQRIYLDYAAATPADPRVIRVVESTLTQTIANPSSAHSFGRESRQRLVKARDDIAQYLRVRPEEIIFTSGATEGANMILRGMFSNRCEGHIITSGVEHPCVHNVIQDLEKRGCEVTYLNPGEWGAVKSDQVEKALQPNTRLIAIMAVNNETGVKSDVEGIAQVASQADVPYFSDGAAWLGKEQLTIPGGLSAISFSGQKVYAPMGVGFCFVRRGLKLAPLIIGGGQEHSRRGGTENLSGIAGLAEAIALLGEDFSMGELSIQARRDLFEESLGARLPGVSINGEGPRVGGTSNVCFEGVDGETLLTALDMAGVAASHGSACQSGALEPSRVLLNMGLSIECVRSSVRFSFGRPTTKNEVNAAVDILVDTVRRLREYQ